METNSIRSTGERPPAVRMLSSLMDYSQHALKRHEDTAYVNDGLARLMHHGTGATIQRDRFHAGGFTAVLEEATTSIAN